MSARFLEHLWRWMRQVRFHRRGWILLTVLVCLFALRLWLPHLVRQEVVKRLSASTPATVRLADVTLSLLRGRLVLKGLSLTLPGEDHPALAADALAGSVRYLPLLRGRTEIDEVRLSGVQASVARLMDGTINLQKLLPPPSPEPHPETDLPHIIIRRLQLAEVEVTYRDEADRAAAEPLHCSLYDLTTEQIALQAQGFAAPVKVQFRGSLNLGGVAGEGQVYWSRVETTVDANLKLHRLGLALLKPYLQKTLTLQKLSGEADAGLHYRLRRGGTEAPVHTLDGAVSFLDVSLVAPSAERPLFEAADGAVAIEQIDLLSQSVRITSLHLREPRLFLLQTPEGLNFSQLLTKEEEPAHAQPPPEHQAEWKVSVGDIRTEGGALVYHDSTWADDEVMQVLLDELQLQNVDFAESESPFHFQVHEGKSTVTSEGAVRFSPFWVDARLQLADVAPASVQPFLRRIGEFTPVNGALNGPLHTVVSMQDGRLSVSLDGTLEAPAFAVRGLPTPENTLAWETAHIEVHEGSTVLPLRLDLAAQFAHLTLQNLPQGDVSIGGAAATLQLKRQSVAATDPSPSQSAESVPTELASTRLEVQGAFDVQSFLVSQGPEKQELLSCHHTRGRIKEGSLLLPFDLRFADIALEYPYVQGFRTASGQIQFAKPTAASPPESSLTGVKSGQEPSSSGPPVIASAPSALAVRLEQIVLVGGQLYVEDHAVAPVQTIYWQDIHIDVSDIAYPLARPNTFALHAFNMDGAPIEVSGATTRKSGQVVTNIHGAVDRLGLSRFNAYLAPLLGYRVRKGSISVKWDIALPGDLVQANAAVTLHDLGLSGKQSASDLEQQVGLSMSLILALLKDLNGNINLNLPVEGRLSEPGFRVGGTMWQAIRDALIGAVTSPLKLLGALFSKSDTLEDFALDPIRFIVGSSQLTLTGKEQINRLRVFMRERPEIDLQLNSTVGSTDQQALQEQRILAQLQSSAQATEAQATPATKPTEQPAGEQGVTPEEEVRQFLLLLTQQRLDEKESPAKKISPQAAALLESFRKTVPVSQPELTRLAQDRLQTVIAALSGNGGVSPDRLHLAQGKLRGRGASEVQYMIQARERR